MAEKLARTVADVCDEILECVLPGGGADLIVDGGRAASFEEGGAAGGFWGEAFGYVLVRRVIDVVAEFRIEVGVGLIAPCEIAEAVGDLAEKAHR